MSHFSMLVTGNVETAMKPFDEGIVVDKYLKYTKAQLIAKGKKEIKEQINGEQYKEYLKDPKKYAEKSNPNHLKWIEETPIRATWSDEKIYKEEVKWYIPDMIGKKGEVYSTYNPKSKWDWYEIGGRWDNQILTLKNGKHANTAKKSDIDWNKSDQTFGILHNGKWHEQAKIGWFAIITEEKDEKHWNKEYQKIIDSIKDDEIVSVIDCHI